MRAACRLTPALLALVRADGCTVPISPPLALRAVNGLAFSHEACQPTVTPIAGRRPTDVMRRYCRRGGDDVSLSACRWYVGAGDEISIK